MAQEKYSASKRAAEKVPPSVEIGGREFKVKRTGKALKQIIALAPDDVVSEDPAVNVDTLYKGIGLMLIDEEGNHPDDDWLENELDFEVAQDLMEKFLPSRRAEGNEETSNDQSTNGSDALA